MQWLQESRKQRANNMQKQGICLDLRLSVQVLDSMRNPGPWRLEGYVIIYTVAAQLSSPHHHRRPNIMLSISYSKIDVNM